MTSSSVSVQGLTYQITCVSLENCLTSGVHLSVPYNTVSGSSLEAHFL